jgi:uncharacterized protein (TIGR03435 family)
MQERRYDIHANVPTNAPKGHIPEMLQNLLADRFQLKLHWETREESGYTLTVAKGGPKLKRSATNAPLRPSDPTASFTSTGHIELPRSTMTRFASLLRGLMGQPVVDNTGLQGEYDVVFEASPATMPGFTFGRGQESEFPAISVALRQLGLNLTRVQKVSTRYLVVDSALKAPTAN